MRELRRVGRGCAAFSLAGLCLFDPWLRLEAVHPRRQVLVSDAPFLRLSADPRRRLHLIRLEASLDWIMGLRF